MSVRQNDTLLRTALRAGYRAACSMVVLANMLVPRYSKLAVHYGGARVGDVGGPLVKVRRLREHFPEVRFRFSLVYLLSNTPYLSSLALSALKLRKVPIVYNQNGVYYGAWYEGDWERENAQMAQAYHAADWVFYQSEFCQRAANLFLGERKGGGEVLYNAVDTRHYSPRDNWTTPGERYTFLITGKINRHLAYRIESAIEGLHYARAHGLDARVKIAGVVDADVVDNVNALRERLGLREDQLVFSGYYSQSEAPDVYRSADAYIMTKYNDPCPNVVLEALSCGLPVIYSASGGVPELVGSDAGVGLSCPLDDWVHLHAPSGEDVGKGMVEVARRHAEFSATARQRAVAKFDLIHWINRHREVFTSLLSEKKKGDVCA